MKLLYCAFQEKAMQEAKKFALDVSLTLIASMINMLLTFIISIILARYLGAAELGLYRLTYTFYGVATTVGALGIPAAIIKYVAEYKDDKVNLNKMISSAIITSLIVGIILCIMVYLLSQSFADLFKMPGIKRLLEMLGPVFPFVLVNAVLYGTLNGLRDMNKYATALIIQQVLMTLSTAILIYYGYGVSGAIIGIMISSIGVSAILIYWCKARLYLTFEEYVQTTKKLACFGSQMFGANLINMINLQADTVFLGYFLTAADVGFYSAATGLSKFFWVVPQAIQTISYPATSEYWSKRDIGGLQKMLDKSMKYSALALIPAGLAIGFFAEEMVTIIYGQGFYKSALPLQILLIGTVIFGVFCTSIGGSLAGVNRPDLGLKAAGFSAAINILLNIVLIPRFGVLGAATATALSLITMALIFYTLTIKTLLLNANIKWIIKIAGITSVVIIFFVIFSTSINTNLLKFCLLFSVSVLYIIILIERDEIVLLKSSLRAMVKK